MLLSFRPFPLSTAFAILLLWIMASATSRAADEFVSLRERQVKMARQFEIYDFEPRPGRLDNRDADYDNIPDYWTKVHGPTYPEYEQMRIVQDPWRQGYDPEKPGHVLYMTYSGTEVAAETTIPRRVDPQLAYEVTAFARTRGLDHSIVTIDIVWLHIDEKGAEEVLGERDQLVIPPGQRDWPEAPLMRRINDLDRRANAVRLVCRVTDNPDIPGADRHGEVWFDDIRIVNRPKIGIAPIFRDDEKPLQFVISYQGLKKNIRRSPGAGPLDGKEYWSRVEIKNVHGERIPVEGRDTISRGGAAMRRLSPGNSHVFIEEIKLLDWLEEDTQTPTRQQGVFYVNVVLYGANKEPMATVTEVVGRWSPPRNKPQLKGTPGALDNYGVGLDPFAITGGLKEDLTYDTLRHLGVFRTKMEVWANTADGVVPDKELQTMSNLLRRLRGVGVRFTGAFGRMPVVLIPTEHMFAAMRDRFQLLRENIRRPVMQMGPQIDDWQWGAATDPSFNRSFDPAIVQEARDMLQEFTSAFNQSLPVTLGETDQLPAAEVADSVNIFVPADMDENDMMQALLDLLPLRFAELTRWEKEIYPSAYIGKLAEEANRRLEKMASRDQRREEESQRPLWLDIEPLPLDPHLREPIGERTQTILLARKAVLGRVLGFERVFLGNLTDPDRGLVTTSREGHFIPRPSFLAVRTLAEYLSGGEYLGSFQFGADVRNYVFRSLENPEKAIVALWYIPQPGGAEKRTVDIGIGWGKLDLIDMAGNRFPVRKAFEVSAMPVLLEGMPVKAARTRMSIRIMEDPPLESLIESQQQRLHIRNFHTEPLVGTIRLVYAASLDLNSRGEEILRLEPGWTSPAGLRINLPAGGEDPGKRVEARRYYDVRPTPESVWGTKFVRVEVQLAAASEMRYKLLRTTDLTSDLSMKVQPIAAPERPSEQVVRLTINWAPDPNRPHPPSLLLKPYYQVAGDQHTYQGTMTVYPVKGKDNWEGAAIRDIRIPRAFVGRRLWIGVDEENGSRFLRVNVTHDFNNMDNDR